MNSQSFAHQQLYDFTISRLYNFTSLEKFRNFKEHFKTY